MTCVFFSLVSADLENIDDGLESLCLSVTEHALSGEFFLFFIENREEFSVYLLRHVSLMHSALEHGGEMWVQNQRHCVVFFGKKCNSYSASL